MAIKAVDAGSDMGITLPPITVIGTPVYESNDPYNPASSMTNGRYVMVWLQRGMTSILPITLAQSMH